MVPCAVFWSVGPGSHEVARSRDLVAALAAHEPEVEWIVLVDDAPSPRVDLSSLPVRPGCELMIVRNPRNGRGRGVTGGLAVGVLTALSWIVRHTEASFALKLDTDSLVIAPFACAIDQAFRDHPDVGILGSHEHTPNGELRNSAYWLPLLRSLGSPIHVRRIAGSRRLYLTHTLWGELARIRSIVRRARRNGYVDPEHCIGGGYAVSRELLVRMAHAGYLADPLLWLKTNLGEDVMMGILARACGLRMMDLNRDGQPFGVEWQGLPDIPERLQARGYAIIHSLKNDPRATEAEIRSFFQTVRESASEVS